MDNAAGDAARRQQSADARKAFQCKRHGLILF